MHVPPGDGTAELTCGPADTHSLRTALEDAGFTVSAAELTRVPTSFVEVAPSDEEGFLKLLDALEDLEDVSVVYHNAQG